MGWGQMEWNRDITMGWGQKEWVEWNGDITMGWGQMEWNGDRMELGQLETMVCKLVS